MKLSKVTTGLGSIGLSWALWALQMMQPPIDVNWYVFDDLHTFIYDHKTEVALIVVLVTVGLIIANNVILYDKPRKRWLKEYLNDIIKNTFKGEYETTRITIFQIKSGWRIFLPYIYYALIRCGWSHIKDDIYWMHIKNIPNPFKKYICMYVRCSNPYEGGSSTYFKLPKEPKNISGIVAHCIYAQSSKIIDTELISDFFDSNKEKTDYSDSDLEKINTYIKDNNITFDKMRCMHRLSNHLYAEPIINKDETIWGALVIDIDSPAKSVFNKKQDHIKSVVRTISLSMNYFE